MTQDPISITHTAKLYFINLLEKNNQNALILRVNSKGCSGNSYQLDTIANIDPLDIKIELEPAKFLAIESKSLIKLWGTQIDVESNNWATNLIFNNPNSQQTCGCGKSFAVESTCEKF